MANLERGTLGYRFDLENKPELEAKGTDSKMLLKAFKDAFPTFNLQANPVDVFDILDQQMQGACAGHALAAVFSVCYYLATRRREAFSRGGAYYLAQQKDGIRGDQGSTLSACRWVATEHGLCLEKDWPYPPRYNPTKPAGIQFPYKLKVSKPMKTLQEVMDWLEAGLPVQIGLPWDSYAEKEIVDNFSPSRDSGGHSTTFWLKTGENVNNLNSWGQRWNGDGVHKWTPKSIEQALRHEWTVMIGYSPDEMSFPNPSLL